MKLSPFLVLYLRTRATRMALKPIAELLQEQVRFRFYARGELNYETDSGFRFAVPTIEVWDEKLMATDEAKHFARWIRAQYTVYARALERNRT